MSHLSIFEPAWIDLVFEGRNKEYGAYQLRRDNPKTTIKALFVALMVITAVICVLLFTGSGAIIVNPIIDDVHPTVELHKIHFPKTDPPKRTTVIPVSKSDAPKAKPTMAKPILVKTEDPAVQVPKNADLPATTSPSGTGTGTTGGTSPTGGGTEVTTTEGTITDIVTVYKSVDKLPQYPGGIDKFYQYVGKNFRSPESEQISGTSIRVVVSFVIERDGSMTDFKVLQNPGYGMDKEAIRVLKSLKIKWEPGKVKGNPVRTAYSLPISVKAL